LRHYATSDLKFGHFRTIIKQRSILFPSILKLQPATTLFAGREVFVTKDYAHGEPRKISNAGGRL
jgi:hypothetical protein